GFSFEIINDSRWNLLRLNADGTLDKGFYPYRTVNTSIKAMARQADGKLLVSGYFWFLSESMGIGLERLFEDGTSDHSFFVGAGVLDGINAIAIQPGGTIWLGGTFTK